MQQAHFISLCTKNRVDVWQTANKQNFQAPLKQPTTETTTRFNTNVFIFCRRGSMLSTAIFVYAATSPVNGYFGGSLYAKQGGKQVSVHLFHTETQFSPFTESATLFSCGSFRQKMDQTNVHWGIYDPSDGLWDGLLHKLHRYLLPRLQSHPIRYHGRFHKLMLPVYFICDQTERNTPQSVAVKHHSEQWEASCTLLTWCFPKLGSLETPACCYSNTVVGKSFLNT